MNHDHGLEREVLASLLFCGDTPPDGYDRLIPDDFTLPEHAIVFRTLLTLWNESDAPPSLAAIVERARQGGELVTPEQVARIAEAVGTQDATFRSRCMTLRTLLCRRRLAAIRAVSVSDPEEHARRIEQVVAEVRSLAWTDDRLELSALDALIAGLTDHERRIPTGFADLDLVVVGMGPGELIVVGARPSVGKSAFTLGLALNVAANGLPVLYASLEQSRTAQLWRAAAIITRTDALAIKNRPQDHQAELVQASEALTRLPLRVVEPPWELAGLERLIAEDVRKRGTRVVVVDYLQLVRVETKTEYERVTRVASALKHLARRLSVPLVVCAQVGRSGAQGRPSMSQLKGSGQIEQDADQVWLLHRDADKDGRLLNDALVIVDKNRDGGTGVVLMDFFAGQTRFACKNRWDPFLAGLRGGNQD